MIPFVPWEKVIADGRPEARAPRLNSQWSAAQQKKRSTLRRSASITSKGSNPSSFGYLRRRPSSPSRPQQTKAKLVGSGTT